jgi:hypothetical protein
MLKYGQCLAMESYNDHLCTIPRKTILLQFMFKTYNQIHKQQFIIPPLEDIEILIIVIF